MFPLFCINNSMRAKEFIIEYAITKKPDFTRVSAPCTDCHGTGNVDKDGNNQTCPTCKGVGSQNQQDNAGFASDRDHQMNMQSTYANGGL